jgi:hypothetical protein
MNLGVKWENPYEKQWAKSLESIPALVEEKGV